MILMGNFEPEGKLRKGDFAPKTYTWGPTVNILTANIMVKIKLIPKARVVRTPVVFLLIRLISGTKKAANRGIAIINMGM